MQKSVKRYFSSSSLYIVPFKRFPRDLLLPFWKFLIPIRLIIQIFIDQDVWETFLAREWQKKTDLFLPFLYLCNQI